MLKALLAHPMSGCSLTSFARILRRYYRPSPDTAGTVLLITVALLLLLPFRLAEALRHGARVRVARPAADPIFIIGHWRSGTTFLEELLSSDAGFGFCRYFGNQFPYLSVAIETPGTLLNRVFAKVRLKRPQDNVVLGIDTPSEEEFSIAKSSVGSFLLAWIFRDRWDELLGKFLTMEDATEAEMAEWRRTYLALVRKWTYINGGRRLVMKSPYNTARVRHILGIFPDAKFIHITREPREAIVSTIDMLHKMSPFALSRIDEDVLKDKIIETYRIVAAAYGEQRGLVPERNIVQIRFEDLMRDPQAAIEAVYAGLELPLSEETRRSMAGKIRRHSAYQRNSYPADDDLARRGAEAIAAGNAAYGYGTAGAA